MRKVLSRLWEDERLLVSATLLLALVTRLGAVFYLGVPDVVEVSEEGQIAARLIAGQGYTFDFYGYRTAEPLRSFIPPLYVLFVAFFLRFAPEPGMALGVTQAFLSSLTCVVVYRIARGLSGMTVGILSGLAMALYPVFIIQTARPFSLTVNILLLALLLWLLLDLRHRSCPTAWVAAGVALGLLTLSRSSILAFLVGILGWLWLNRKGILKWHQAATVIVFSSLFTLLPWTLHNYYVLGQLSPLSTCGGFTFWNGNNPFTTGNVFDVYVGKVRAYLGTEVGGEAGEEAIMDLRPYPLPHEIAPYVHRLSEAELDRALYQAGWRFIQENPGQWLALAKTKLVSLWWFRPNLGRSRADLGEHGLVYDSRWIMPYKLLYAALFPFFLAGVVLSFSRWRIYSLFYILFLYLTIVYVAFHVMTRFRWEIEPYILLFAIIAIVDIGQRILSRFGRGPLALLFPSDGAKWGGDDGGGSKQRNRCQRSEPG